MYSQNNEEKFILEHFKNRKGKFLDIGAYDGKTFSNTFALVELGWSGLEIEASPINFVNLMKNVRKPNVDLLCAAITPEGGILDFYDSQGDAISTSDTAHRDKWSTMAGGVDWQKISIPSITVNQLLETYGNDFDFIDVDVEGYSYELFCMFPWDKLDKCSLIIVEHDNRAKDIEKRLEPLGYKNVYQSAENIILTR